MADPIPQPSPDLPPPVGPGPSPFWPQHLIDLFVRPTNFFTGQLALGKTPYVVLVTWVLGISATIDRIDSRIIQADLRDDPNRWQALEMLVGTWPRFWAFVIPVGLLAGAFYWWIGGWWCRVRLHWSGAPSSELDSRLARLLLVYSSFVFAGPAVLASVIQTVMYPSYLVAYEQDFILALPIIAALFWSTITTYKGAVALFPVKRGLAAFWFVVLPTAFFFVVAGGAALLFAAAA